MKKRVLSLVLAFIMLISSFSVICIPASAAYNYLFPVNNGGVIAYYYGYTDKYGGWHDGLDIHSNGDDYIYAAFSGKVGVATDPCWHVSYGSACEHVATFGNYIRIDQDDGNSAYYGHLLQGGLLVSVGQYVTKGQPIALMGSSGYSTGKHLHFEVRNGSTKLNVNPTCDGGEMNYSYTGYNGQNISYTSITPDTYLIRNTSNDLYLTVDSGLDANENNVSVWEYSSHDQFRMKITTVSDAYKIRPLCSSSRYINVFADTVVSGKNVNIYNDTNDSSQWWRFEAVSGGYVIRNAQNPNCVLNVDNRNVYVSTYTGAKSQIWALEPSQFKVTFNANGGSGTPASQTKYYKENLTLSTVKPTRSGYEFLGWSTSKTATSATYSSGGTYKTDKAVTLYAVWKKENPIVTGECGDNATYTFNKDTGKLVISGTGEIYFSHNNPIYDQITSIEIQNGITSVNADAFTGCSNLTDLVIAPSVKSLGQHSFKNCTKLKNLTLNEGLETIGSASFQNTAITEFTIPSTVTTLGNYVFQNCQQLDRVIIPNSVRSIGQYSFHACPELSSVRYLGTLSQWNAITVSHYNKQLTDLAINCYDADAYWTYSLSSSGTLTISGNTNIPHFAPELQDCPWVDDVENIKKIVIKDGITGIGSHAFKYCENAESISIPESVTRISSAAFQYTKIKDIVIPSKVTSIPNYAFNYCENLETVTIPMSVKNIGGYSFHGCDSLKTVNYGGIAEQWNGIVINAYNEPLLNATVNFTEFDWYYDEITKTLKILRQDAMANYTSTYSNSVATADTPWFEYADEIENIIIADGITSIGNSAFAGLSAVKNVSIPNSVTKIGANAFVCCVSLESIVIPDSVKDIGGSAFVSCLKLKSVNIPEGVTSLHWTFNNCALESIVIPEGVTDISNAFVKCNLKSVTIPSTVTMTDTAFAGCENLTDVVISEGVTNIGTGMFFYCSSLSNITIPNSMRSIKNQAFRSCDALEFVDYDGTQSEWDEITIGTYNEALTNAIIVTIPEGEAFYDWSYDSGSGALTITGEGALPDFEKNGAPWDNIRSKVYSIVIDEGITTVGDWAFAYMYYVRSVNLPSTLRKIGANSFYQCPKLEEVIIPEKVKTIEGGAFAYCKGMESLSIPTNTKELNNYVFYGCDKLTKVYYAGSASAWSNLDKGTGNDPVTKATVFTSTLAGTTWSFDESTGTLTIGGNARMVNYDAKTAPWYQHYASIKKVVVEEGVTGIGNWAFSYCSQLTDVVLPDSLVHIGSSAFYNCFKLKNINLPSGLRRIYSGAFYNCKVLESITIPIGVTTIYANTFLSCSALANVSYNGTKVQWQKVEILKNNTALTNLEVNCLVKSIEWNLSEDGTLTISGGVAMDDYELNKDPKAPWADVKTQVKKVVIEDGIPNIGKNAFYGCNNLVEVQIPDSVTSIGYGAFFNCFKLKSVEIPEKVTYIGSGAFYQNSALESITIPAGVTSILQNTFYGCKKLATVNYGGDIEDLTVNAKGNDYFINAIS